MANTNIHCFVDVTKDSSPMMKETVERLKKVIGKARNYGPTPEELEQLRKQEEEESQRQEEQRRVERERKEAEEAAERKKRQEEWVRVQGMFAHHGPVSNCIFIR